MAYATKAYTETTRYRLHQAHVNALKLNGIASFAVNQGAAHFAPQTIGRLQPVFRSLNTADGMSVFETVGLGQLLDSIANGGLGVGITPYNVSGVSNSILDLWWNAITELGVNANVGIRARMTKGVLHLQGLTAMQNAPAVAIMQAIPLYDGSNDLWIYDDVPDLATATGALSTDQDCWTFGGVWVDGTQMVLANGATFTNLPFVTMQTGGDPYPRYGHVGEGQMVITVPLQSPTAMPNLGLKNVTGFGTKTDPPVEATSLVVKLVRCDANGQRKALGDGDIILMANYGSVSADAVPGGPAGRLVTALNFFVHDADTADSLLITKNADA
jgi:hypothetical protein